jgi:hypothetical protein
LVSWVIATAVFFFYWISILIYWLFGFKYWVISIHVPRFIGGTRNELVLSSKKFDIINYVVLATYTAICLSAAYCRFQVAHELVGKPHEPNPVLLYTITALYCMMACACITSATFLGCALKNLQRIIKRSEQYAVALKTMNLHIFMMIFHTIFFTAEIVSLCLTFIHPDGKNIGLVNINRVFLFITQSISQLIVMYLIWKLNEKSFRASKASETQSSSGTLDPDLAILFSFKQEAQVRIKRSVEQYDTSRDRFEVERVTLNNGTEEEVVHGPLYEAE